ncbi:MAG: hypothetical protein EOM59_21075 [Clostridia bacterium]|nr:hypothetical protein [Clostridia bacterium]
MRKKRKQLWVDYEIHKSLFAYADAFGMTISDAASKIFREYLAKKETKESAIRHLQERIK